MNNIIIASLIGIIAGIIDVIPMIIVKSDRSSCISAFLHYLVLGLIIPFVNWGIPMWLTGLIVAFLSAIPIMVIVYSKDKRAIIPITGFSIILGSGIGLAGSYFIG
jgi:hypothetical protein